MVVHYYEIHNCICANVNSRPVLIAPPGTEYDRLTTYQFLMLEDGRWCHFLTNEEYAHVMTGYPNRDVVFGNPAAALPASKQPETPEERKAGNHFALIGFLLLGFSILFPIVAGGLTGVLSDVVTTAEDSSSTDNPFLSVTMMIIEGLAGLSQLGAFVMMLVTRIKYPKNVWGKVLMWVYIIGVILLIIAMILLIVACAYCINEMRHCPG